MGNGPQAKILTPQEFERVRYPLPKSWLNAAGLLRHKKVDPVAYQRKLRREWERRLRKLERPLRRRRT